MSHRITLLGTGLIGMFYTMALHGHRGRDRVHVAYSRSADRAQAFAQQWGIPKHTTNLEEAIRDADTDVVIVALPNHLHEEAVVAAAQAGKAVLCTKPLGRNAAEALRMLEAVEKAGVFHGYLEDLCYTPKTLRALEAVRDGTIGKVLWVRSRETHPGPHSDWFWNKELSGGGAIVDLGCHCIEIARNFIGKDIRPVEVMCWGDTQVHPIEAEDHAIGLVRYENGAIGQFEVSWAFRGGMDLRDEVAGTEGTIWLNHWLRTGMEMYTAVGQTRLRRRKGRRHHRLAVSRWATSRAHSATSTCSADMLDSLDAGTTPARNVLRRLRRQRDHRRGVRVDRIEAMAAGAACLFGAAGNRCRASPCCATSTPSTCCSKKSGCRMARRSSFCATSTPAASCTGCFRAEGRVGGRGCRGQS